MSAVDVGSLRGVVALVAKATEGHWRVAGQRNHAVYGAPSMPVCECWLRIGSTGQDNAVAIAAAVNWLRENGDSLAAQLEAHKALVEAARAMEAVVTAMSPPTKARDIPEVIEALTALRAALAPFQETK